MTALTIQATRERVDIFRPGHRNPMLVQHAKADTRAYIHPIVAPDGNGQLTEDTPSHHPWQHGLYVGLNDVNGAASGPKAYWQGAKIRTAHSTPGRSQTRQRTIIRLRGLLPAIGAIPVAR